MDFDFTTETITPDNTNLLTIGGTGGLEIPVGDTATRPISPVEGTIRYNTDLSKIESYIGFPTPGWYTYDGTVTSVDVSGGTTGLTYSGGPITGSGTITLSGTLNAVSGGTGFSSYTVGDLLYANSTTTLGKLTDTTSSGNYLRSGGTSAAPVWSAVTLPNSAVSGDIMLATATNTFTNLVDVATGNAIISGGVGNVPTYGKIGLTTHITGILPLANGGTADALTAQQGGVVYSTASAMAITSAGTSGQVLTSNGTAAPTWEASPAILELYKENASSPVAPVASGANSIAIGSGSTATAIQSRAFGSGANATIYGTEAMANGSFATAGDAQVIEGILRCITTDNTSNVEMFLDGATATQRLVLPNNSLWTFYVQVAARRTDATGGQGAWEFTGCIYRDATAGSTVLDRISRTNFTRNGAASNNPVVTADTTNGSLKLAVTGSTGATVRWTAYVRIQQVTN